MSCGTSEKNKDSKQEDALATTESIQSSESIELSKNQFDGEKMNLVKMNKKPFPKAIKTTGMIDVPPNSRAVISAFAGGYIKNTPLLIGDKVKKGQPLVSIENMDFVSMQQEYLEVAEQLNYLESEYNRQKELFNENISSKKSFLNADSNFKKARAMYNGLRKKLEMLNINPENVENGKITSMVTIFAPISGSISAVNISTGAFVSPADPIMEIINTDHIHLELKVFEKDILKLKEDQKVTFKVPEYSDEIFEGEVHLIGKSIDENRTIPVHAHLKNDENHNFIVGMFVEANIITEESMENALPEDAVIEVENKNYVLVLESETDGVYRFNKKEIALGQTYNGFKELTENGVFKEDTQFLVGGFNLIGEE
jgi:cobalt-zinc-cadmium efflux system membrane fusion protein